MPANCRISSLAAADLSVPLTSAGGGNFNVNKEVAEGAKGGLTKAAFRKYYGLRASASVSRGAHDEWNIFRLINEKRRADSKLGTGNQIPMLFEGRAATPPESEAPVSEGYVGKCPL